MSAMMWMRMPGQTWPGAAASFLGMWVVMMVAMMLPTLIPMLWRYREAAENAGAARLAWVTALVSVGYFFVWTVFGVAVYPVGVVLSAIEMQRPIAVGATVLIIGLLQFTKGKARRVACRLAAHRQGDEQSSNAITAWRHGLRLGMHCVQCCAGLMMVPLIMGVMDLRVMGAVTAAITIERIAPAGMRVPRAIGAVVVGTAMVLIARAVGLG
jgi:predicted metal-binding membrane protein